MADTRRAAFLEQLPQLVNEYKENGKHAFANLSTWENNHLHNAIVHDVLTQEEIDNLAEWREAYHDDFEEVDLYSYPDTFTKREDDIARANIHRWEEQRDNLDHDFYPNRLVPLEDLLCQAMSKAVTYRAFGDTDGIWKPFEPNEGIQNQAPSIYATSAETLKEQFDLQKKIEKEVCAAAWKVQMEPLSASDEQINESYQKVKEHMTANTFRKLVEKQLENTRCLIQEMEIEAIAAEVDDAYCSLLDLASWQPQLDPFSSVDETIEANYRKLHGRVTKATFRQLVANRLLKGCFINKNMKVKTD